MAVTIEGVPETVHRSQVVAMLASIGIEAARVPKRSGITITGDAIRVSVYATDEDRRRYLDGDDVATHDVSIRIVDDGPPCPRCGEPMHMVPTPAEPGDTAWEWGHDCDPT